MINHDSPVPCQMFEALQTWFSALSAEYAFSPSPVLPDVPDSCWSAATALLPASALTENEMTSLCAVQGSPVVYEPLHRHAIIQVASILHLHRSLESHNLIYKKNHQRYASSVCLFCALDLVIDLPFKS